MLAIPRTILLLASSLGALACGSKDATRGDARVGDPSTEGDAAIGNYGEGARLKITASPAGPVCAGGCVDLQAVAPDAHEDDVFTWNHELSGAGPHHVCPRETTRYAVELNAGQTSEFGGSDNAELTLLVEDCAGDAGAHDAGLDGGPDPSGPPTVVCSQRIQTTGPGGARWLSTDSTQAISNDPHGNTVVAGKFTEQLNWDGGSLKGSPSIMAFVSKLDSKCKVLWSRAFSSAGFPRLAIAQQYDSDEVTLLVAQSPTYLSWLSDESWHYVQRLHADGSDAGRIYLGAAYRNERGEIGSIAVDAANNVVVTGMILDTMTAFALPSASYVLRYDASGNRVGAETTQALDKALQVTTTASGEIALTGPVRTSYALGGSTVNASGAEGDNLTLLATNGDYRWDRMLSKRAGDSHTPPMIMRGRTGHLMVVYRSSSEPGSDVTIEDWTTEGELVWQTNVPGSANGSLPLVRTAPDGRVFFLADYFKSFDFGGKSFTVEPGSTRVLYGSLDASGKLLHVDLLKSNLPQSYASGIGVDASNQPVMLSTESSDSLSLDLELVLTKMSH